MLSLHEMVLIIVSTLVFIMLAFLIAYISPDASTNLSLGDVMRNYRGIPYGF